VKQLPIKNNILGEIVINKHHHKLYKIKVDDYKNNITVSECSIIQGVLNNNRIIIPINLNLLKNYDKWLNFTNRDMNSLDINDEFEIDKRSFNEYFVDLLKNNHTILTLFYQKSILKPLFIRLIRFFFEFFTIFALNAYFYTDDFIENNNNYFFTYTDAQRNEISFKSYSLINTFKISLTVPFLVLVLSFIINLVNLPTKKVLDKFNESCLTMNEVEILAAK